MDNAEFEEKTRRVRDLLDRRGLDALLLNRSANAAWLSCGGRTYINTATDTGVGSLLVTPTGHYLLTDNIEADRLRDEEGFDSNDWEIVAEPWYEPGRKLAELTSSLRVGTDLPRDGFVDVSADVAQMRWLLTPAEVERFRALGADAGAALGEAATQVRPGMTEDAIAGLLAEAVHRHGAVPVVVLVASDDRLRRRRHPLPTGKPLEHTAMLVICARRHGLVASATRFVHFGELSEEQRRGTQAVATVEATTLLATKPGVKANSIFRVIQDAYRQNGYPGEWENHHQGGAAGYEARDYVATPYTEHVVQAVQAFAWNPSVPGAKSEDTYLITDGLPELLTATPGWPQQQIEVGGVVMQRPDILIAG
ncbi:MAG: aminopeptidase P family protein [Chloroflexota bacterium]